MLAYQDDLDRRRFLSLCAGALAATLVAGESDAADLPHVDPKDPLALAVGYVEDTTTVDAKKFPQHKPTQACVNCKVFTKQAGSEYGACQIFAGKAVHEHGWCSTYQAKA